MVESGGTIINEEIYASCVVKVVALLERETTVG